jgi:hypothetical protein
MRSVMCSGIGRLSLRMDFEHTPAACVYVVTRVQRLVTLEVRAPANGRTRARRRQVLNLKSSWLLRKIWPRTPSATLLLENVSLREGSSLSGGSATRVASGYTRAMAGIIMTMHDTETDDLFVSRPSRTLARLCALFAANGYLHSILARKSGTDYSAASRLCIPTSK